MTTRASRLPHPSLSLVLMAILFGTLLLGGGASRADALGQVLVRSVAWILLMVTILFGQRPPLDVGRPVLLFLLAALALPLLQLIPLPPSLWQALPGRSVLARAAAVAGQPQPWRPLAIVPGAAVNAAGSLIVPFATLILALGLRRNEWRWLLPLVLAFVVATTVVGLLQFSNAGFRNPLINGTLGEVSGTFANRNHFALLVAMGCALVPAWAFSDGRSPHWRAPVAFGLTILFALTILSSGSRAGLALGAIGIGGGLILARHGVRRLLSRYPRWVFPVLVAVIIVLVGIFVFISFAADRAIAINRVLGMDAGQDMRARGFPVVISMIRQYLPLGAGLGGFDPLFRINEPFPLLRSTYFNHAHNDWLEIVLDAGIPGALLLLAAVGWWGWASVRAWRGRTAGSAMLAQLGSVLLLLVFVASLFDYPARTPTVMAMIVIAALCLCGLSEAPARPAAVSALPG